MAFSVSWTVIASNRLDPDEPLTTQLMNELNDNAVYNSEWIGDQTDTPVEEHHHQGKGVDGTVRVEASDISGASALFDSAIFSFSGTWAGSSTTQITTGALGFDPIMCWCIGQNSRNADFFDNFVGFARGTGNGAGGMIIDLINGSTDDGGYIDSNAIGGTGLGARSTVTPTVIPNDLDVTVFDSSEIELEFVNPGTNIAYGLELIVIGSQS